MTDHTATDHTDIRCPHCDHRNDFSTDMPEGVVTYWAEDGATEITCEHCDHSFWMNEDIQRSWQVTAGNPDD